MPGSALVNNNHIQQRILTVPNVKIGGRFDLILLDETSPRLYDVELQLSTLRSAYTKQLLMGEPISLLFID